MFLSYYYLLTYTGVQYDINIWWYSCRVTITWRKPLVDHYLPTLPVHQSSHQGFSWYRVAQSSVFHVVFCGSLLAFFVWSLYFFFILRLLQTKGNLNAYINNVTIYHIASYQDHLYSCKFLTPIRHDIAEILHKLVLNAINQPYTSREMLDPPLQKHLSKLGYYVFIMWQYTISEFLVFRLQI